MTFSIPRRKLVKGSAALAAMSALNAAPWRRAFAVPGPTVPPYISLERRYVYPILGDGRVLTDGAITAGANVLSSATAFTVFDLGKLVTVAGAGPAGVSLNTSITSISGSSAVLAASAATSVSAASCTVARDHSAALQALINLAAANGGGLLYLPTGLYGLSATLTWASKVSMVGDGAGKSVLKWMASGDMTSSIIQGLAYTGNGAGSYNATGNLYVDCQFRDLEFDGSAGTMSTYTSSGKAIFIQYMLRPRFDRIYAHDFPSSGLGIDYMQDAVFDGNIVSNCGRLNSGSQAGGAGIGIGIGGLSGVETYTVVNNSLLNNKTYGIFFEGQGANNVDAQAVVIGNRVRVNATTTGSGIADCGLRRFECVGNHIEGAGVSPNGTEGITVRKGTVANSPGVAGLIADNIVLTVGGNGISIDYTTAPAGTTRSAYDIRGNKIQNCFGHGVKLTSNATAIFDTVNVSGNTLSANALSGVYLVGAGGFQDASMIDNVISNNGSAGSGATASAVGIAGNVVRLRMVGNQTFDNSSGAQKYGLSIAATVTAALVLDNDFKSNATGAINVISGSIAGIVKNNPGYNPLGPVVVTVTGSPMTYTAGNTPEQLRINGGTVSAVTKNSIVLASSTGTEVDLEPGETVVITYSAAPTLVADRR